MKNRAIGVNQLQNHKNLEITELSTFFTFEVFVPLIGYPRTMPCDEPCSASNEPFRCKVDQSKFVQSEETHQVEHRTRRVRCLLSCSMDAYLAGLLYGFISSTLRGRPIWWICRGATYHPDKPQTPKHSCGLRPECWLRQFSKRLILSKAFLHVSH